MIHLLREANTLLGALTFFGLLRRIPEAWSRVASKRVFLSLCLFPIGVTIGSAYAVQHNFPPGPMAPYFTVAYVILGVVLIWWPESLRRLPRKEKP